MSEPLPASLTLMKRMLERVDEAGIAGHSYVDEQGRWALQLQISDGGRAQLISVFEGDSVEFAGATWTVSEVVEPTTTERGPVATLTRVGGGSGGG